MQYASLCLPLLDKEQRTDVETLLTERSWLGLECLELRMLVGDEVWLPRGSRYLP